MKASIVIPAYNASPTLPLVLDALTEQNTTDFEVIVVDDASADNTSAIAEEYTKKLDFRVFRACENLGRARARNFGVEKSKGDIVLLLDSDIQTVPEYVWAHLSLHEKESKAVGVGALKYPPELAKKALARYYSARGAARLKQGQPIPGKYFVSCLASFRRTLFDEVGGFDTRFRYYGGEDLELGLRFEKSGAHLAYIPEAVGYHHHLRPLKEVISTLEKYGREGIPIVLSRHPEFAAELALEDLTDLRKTRTGWLKAVMRRSVSSPLFFYPLLEIAGLLQDGYLPSPLLTYLHYRAYRKGYTEYLYATARNASL